MAGAVAAGLLLTACGSDSGDDEIAGVDDAAASEAQDEDEPEGDQPDDAAEDEADGDGIDRPDIQVADSLELVFEEPDTGDPVKDAILTDSQWQVKSVFEVLTTHDIENESVSFYTTGESYREDIAALNNIIDQGGSSAGIMKFSGYEVSSLEGDTAFVTYCRDFSEAYNIDFETGEVIGESNLGVLPTRYEVRMQKNDIGVWQANATSNERRSKRC
ncbi:hypothetical protein [Streptomyces otsuchiensis]|uniref:hypothetical protein n=1 Tax=Streptomyces otsuchiensis TaxID=2681388 RepID=UPI00102F9785|nr:hypothetical protein [Streptomyces otsuchiensis]